MKKILYGVILVGLFSGCGDDKITMSTSPTNDGVAVSQCSSGMNLVKNGRFVLDPGQSIPDNWGASQHSGEPSFEVEITSGVLSINKIGTQPWFTFTQNLDVVPFEGRKMSFSADLKLSLSDDNLDHAFVSGGGLFLLIYGDPDPIGGDSVLLDLSLKHEPKLGTTDWKSVGLDFKVPAKATRMVFGFVHKANGSMSVRNPVLAVCGDGNG